MKSSLAKADRPTLHIHYNILQFNLNHIDSRRLLVCFFVSSDWP